MDTKDFIFTVFNVGVAARREIQFANVQAASNYFYDVIYSDLSRQYKGFIDDVFILSYADYLTSIAVLGYILPYVCAYDEGFKSKLMDLILLNVAKPREVSGFEELQNSMNKEKPTPVQVC